MTAALSRLFLLVEAEDARLQDNVEWRVLGKLWGQLLTRSLPGVVYSWII